MKAAKYSLINDYMLENMHACDGAHDAEHVLRVLGVALDIAAHEEGVDMDVLIAACLLHDIGRREQALNPAVCHAAAGAQKAQAFLEKHGFGEEFARRVADCIRTHRFRGKGARPESVEARILFDADKIDVCGAIGVARTLLYQGRTGERLYGLCANGCISDGVGDACASFFQEYRYKLEGVAQRLFTSRGRQIALERQPAARAFYEAMLQEVRFSREDAQKRLAACLQEA